MRIIQRICIVLLLMSFATITAQNKKANINFTAKLLERRLEKVNLSQSQWNQFYDLSEVFKSDLLQLRKEYGISDLIKKRDKVHRQIIKERISKDLYYDELQERMGITAHQTEGFKKTVPLKNTYKKAVMALLSKEQKTKFSKTGKKKPKRDH